MSIESIAIALHHSASSGTVKLVLVGIANHDGDGGAWPSIATLSKYAGVSARRVQQSITTLEGLGEVKRLIMEGGDRRTASHMRPNLYEFLLVCPSNCDRTKNHRLVDNSPPDPVKPVAPGEADCTGGVKPVAGDPVKPAAPEPSLEPPLNQTNVPSLNPVSPMLCMACGKPGSAKRSYCSSCITSGLDNPMVSCVHCGTARRREAPGEMSFDCGCAGG